MKTVQVKLAIKDVAVMLNKNGKLTITTESSKYNESGVFQLTPKHLDNIADKAFKVSGDTIADAVAYGNQMFDTSFLVITFRFCKAGEEIGLDKEGNPIMTDAGETTFSKDHWRTESFDGIELGEEAALFIKEIARELAKDREKERRAGQSKRKQQQRTPKVEGGADKGGNPELEAEQHEIEEELDSVFGDNGADKPE